MLRSPYEKALHDIVLQAEISPAVRDMQAQIAQESVSSRYAELAKSIGEISQKLSVYVKLAQTLSSPEMKERYQKMIHLLEVQQNGISNPQDNLEKNIGKTPPIEESENPNEQAENADPQSDNPEH